MEKTNAQYAALEQKIDKLLGFADMIKYKVSSLNELGLDVGYLNRTEKYNVEPVAEIVDLEENKIDYFLVIRGKK